MCKDCKDYNATLNLPKTDFPMRAGLPKSEPVTLRQWEDEKVYEKLMEQNEGKPLFVLHDGPPYANGDIHLGHALNKILKDFIVRYKNMAGFKSPFVPGWDTHGLPTELKARQKAGIGSSADISVVELRKLCEEFVTGYINDQREQFKRLGCIGEWDNPYITLKHEFEAEQIKVFAEMADKGYIYRGLKPVFWCPECKTALAEAEKDTEVAEPAAKDEASAAKKKPGIMSKVLKAVMTAVTSTLAAVLGAWVSEKVSGKTSKKRTSTKERVVKNATSAATRTITKELTRDILGNLIK